MTRRCSDLADCLASCVLLMAVVFVLCAVAFGLACWIGGAPW